MSAVTPVVPSPHVLIIVENLPVPADYRVWLIATTLRSAGYAVSVIAPATAAFPAGSFVLEGIHIERHRMPREARHFYQYFIEYGAALWHELRLSLRIFKRRRFAIVHACNPPDLLWLIGIFWRLRSVRFIFDHHDLCPELILAKSHCQTPRELSLPRRMLYTVALLLERISFRCAARVLATNASYRRVALTRGRCRSEHVRVVTTAPRRAEIDAAPQHIVAPAAAATIVYVGVMAVQDGVDGLLCTFARLLGQRPQPCTLLLIGDGPERAALEELARQLGISAHVQFAGFMARADMLRCVAACDVGVTPDPPGPMNNASTMLKVLDYMICGVPQVMYDLPENRATAGDCAVYAQPGSEADLAHALQTVLDNTALRTQLAAAARARITRLAWEENGAPALLDVYASLLALPPDRTAAAATITSDRSSP
jgi:glycosyltransferase involved in cell wall biosynthesis